MQRCGAFRFLILFTVLLLPLFHPASAQIVVLDTVKINAATGKRNIGSPKMGVEQLNLSEIRNIPILLGERDVMKTLQLLPGVKSGNEGNGGFFVRGGGADQNMILLDDAPIYNASHLMGFFSVFNSDALKNVTLYKSGMPAQYGGALSSVLDVKMNDGNNQRYAFSGGIGLISARLNAEGPIIKDRSSFLVSVRRTYADAFLKLASDTNLNASRLYFYDVNAKVNYLFNARNRLYISLYIGKDVLASPEYADVNWGNATSTLRWNHIFNTELVSNASLIFSNYNYRIQNSTQQSSMTLFSQIRDWNYKQDFQWYANTKNTFNFGFNAIYHTIKPGEVETDGNTILKSQKLQDRYSLENAVYGSNTWKPSNHFSLTYGLRISAFSILGKGDYYTLNAANEVIETKTYKSREVVKTYANLEPRLAAALALNASSSVKISYVRNVQNLHLIANSNSSSPADRWVASTNIIKPEISNQVSLGYYRDLLSQAYELTVESYYKKLQNQIDYSNEGDVFTNKPIETQLHFGKGRAYGIEFLFKKKTGRLTGWLGYTLSKSERNIAGINNGQWYNARQDRTHDIAVVGMYKLDKKWTVSANWVYATGSAVTWPNAKYKVFSQVYYYYDARNADRMSAYHRLDLGATRILQQSSKFSSELNFSLYNAYARQNAYQINFRSGQNDTNTTEAVQTTLFKIVPSVTYNFRF
ncbi:TonB-dependent receptor [Pedobacter sp. MC2016-14]|uniref:TonB-dependent receptor plug domain-containing protein n=1 Tax=Pedobacter sp. MC2016-14 TaxID=2897327 RepID=UPI001E5E46DD|nr:TonB-dependent receptor plug domain-containing protein [Pedobacter sp. MC2016-14]MCD0490270.1 TonB-dependent receptor [Pedobacter sp. MC2016-14]